MNLTFLQSFLVVSRKLSISGAARELNLSQPALSRQMRQLELEIGANLLDRTNQGINLTQAGVLLRDRGGRIMESLKQLKYEVRELDSTPRPFNIGVPPGLPVRWIEEFVSQQLEQFPNLRLHELSSTEQLELLRAKQLDLALTREMSNEFLQALALNQPLGIAQPRLSAAASGGFCITELNDKKVIVNTAPEGRTQLDKIQEFFDRNDLNVKVVVHRFDTHGTTIANLENVDFAIVTKETSLRAFPEWSWCPFPELPAQITSQIWATANKDSDPKVLDLLRGIARNSLSL